METIPQQDTLDSKARKALSKALKGFRPLWESALQRRRALWKSGSRRDQFLANNLQLDLDALTGYLATMSGNTHSSEDAFLERVRREDYSAADLFVELLAAQEAMPAAIREASDDTTQEAAIREWSEARIQDLFLRILEETSCVYESMAESGRRGYCQLDDDGRVVFANRGLNELCGKNDLAGTNFWDLFGRLGPEMFAEIKAAGEGWPRCLQLEVETDQRAVPVLIEFAPIPDNRGVSGAYAAVTDLSDIRRAFRNSQNEIFDRAQFGVLRTNRRRDISYANPVALDILGLEDVDGLTLENLMIPPDQKAKLLESFERRLEGDSDTYEVTVTRRSDRRKIPVSIVAIPEVGGGGRVVGAVAILRNREVEVAAERMRNAIETAHSISDLLNSVAREVKGLIDFDAMSVYLISGDGLSTRPIFTHSVDGDIFQTTRWYKSNSQTLEWRESPENRTIEDLEQFLIEKDDCELLANPDVKHTLEKGVRSWYNQPIWYEGAQVAGLSLGAKDPQALARARSVMDALPLVDAVRMIFQLLKLREKEFIIRLLRSLHASKTAEQAAGLLTDEIAGHFQWDNVAIFRVLAEDDELGLVRQANGPTGFRHRAGLTRPLSGSPAGEALESGKFVVLNDLTAESGYREGSFEADTRSVLCIPVAVGGVKPWVAQIEDRQQSAFVAEDLDELRRIMAEVRSLLDDLSEHFRLSHVFRSASDAILTCSNDGRVLEVNGPAVQLFGMSEGQLKESNFCELVTESSLAREILAAEHARETVRVKGGEKKEVKAIVTAFRMPEGFERNVLILQNLALYEELAKQKKLEGMFAALAHRTRAPLSLMQSSLRRLKRRSGPEDVEAFVHKMEAYLRQVDLSLEQIILPQEDSFRMPVRPLAIRVDQMLERVLGHMTDGDRQMIDLDLESPSAMLRVDVYRTDFILETVLGHYLRFVPLDETIDLSARRDGPWVELKVVATLPESADGPDLDSAAREFAANFSVENPAIERFIDELQGEFQAPDPPVNMVCRIRLPAYAMTEART